MRAKKAKALRRMAASIANPNNKGLLHPGVAEIFKTQVEEGNGKSELRLRSIRRTWSMDSPRKLYSRFKRLYVRHELPGFFIRLSDRMEKERTKWRRNASLHSSFARRKNASSHSNFAH